MNWLGRVDALPFSCHTIRIKATNPMRSIVTKLNESYKQQASYWSGSVFEDVVNFSTDYKGKWGEELLRDIIKDYTDIPVQWDEDSNTSNDDGVYDLFWFLHNGKKRRVEVKTSGRTVAKGKAIGWQHENVYFSDDKWDKLVFLDYDANDVIYITVVNYDQLVKDNMIDLSLFGKKGHQRKNEEGKAKVDFSMKSIQRGIDAGVTFKYDFNNPQDEQLGLFLINKLGN
jgi:hypothetical protein